MSLVDLNDPALAWFEAQIAGADLKARMVMLHQDPQRAVRTVLVEFPDGWRRDAVGTQPAGEEMVCLSGALTISGVTATPGTFLAITPRALRAATSTASGTRAVVWFTGEGGGWVDGEELVRGAVTLHDLGPGFVRSSTDGLRGRVEHRGEVAGESFAGDVEIVWPAAGRYCHVPAGGAAPRFAGPAVVRFLD